MKGPGRGRASTALAAGLGALALAACSPPPRVERPNVLLITLDTTRPDRLSAYGYEKPTSPNLDRLAEESIVYDRAFSTSSWTLPAHASLFTGKFPTSHGARWDPEGPLVLTRAIRGPDEWSQLRARGLGAGERTLAAILLESGYRTGAVIGGPWLKRMFGLDRGFEHYDDRGIESPRGRPAHAVTEAAIAWIDQVSPAPFFLFLNYFDPHTPLTPPREHAKLFTPRGTTGSGWTSDPAQVSALYDGEIHYMDFEIGRLFSHLRESGLYDRTWILVTADHGELQGEYGRTGHGKSLFGEEIRVPLLVKYPRGEARPRRSQDPVQLTDLLPMILERLGLPVPDDVQGGRPPETGHPVIAELSALPGQAADHDWKTLVDGRFQYLRAGEGELLLVAPEGDSGPLQDRTNQEPERVRTLRTQLDAYLGALPGPPDAGPERTVDEETRRALENLGYLD